MRTSCRGTTILSVRLLPRAGRRRVSIKGRRLSSPTISIAFAARLRAARPRRARRCATPLNDADLAPLRRCHARSRVTESSRRRTPGASRAAGRQARRREGGGGGRSCEAPIRGGRRRHPRVRRAGASAREATECGWPLAAALSGATNAPSAPPRALRPCTARAAGAQEAARRRADRAPHHRRERARAGVAELGGDARHRHPARRQRHGARQQHLLAPLHERGAELAAKEARHRARAGAAVGGPGGERGMARRVVDAPPRTSRRRRFSLRQVDAEPAPARRGAARRAAGRRGAARARSASRSSAWRPSSGRASSSSASASSRRETSSTRHCCQPADSAAERAGPQRAARLMQVERQQLGVLDHGDRVLDAGRDPDRARRRHDVAAVRRRDADHAGRRQRDLAPGMRMRHDARVGAQALLLGAHRPRARSGVYRCGVSGPIGGLRVGRASLARSRQNLTGYRNRDAPRESTIAALTVEHGRLAP